MVNWLVVSTPLKHIKVSWNDDIPNIWKVIKFHGSKPQTSIYTNIGFPLPLTVHYLVGGFNHLEKYESQREGLSHI